MTEITILQTALDKCRATHTGVNPCYVPEYLEARIEYQKLLVKYGMLAPSLIDRAKAQRKDPLR